MQLKIKRSQRTSGIMAKPIFVLDARAIMSGDEQKLIQKYNLGKTKVYDSQTRRKHAEAVDDHLDVAAATTRSGVLSSISHTVRAGARAAAAAMSLHVTIDGLMQGQHIECKEMGEMLGAESAMVDACETVKSYLAAAATFDGSEQVIEI